MVHFVAPYTHLTKAFFTFRMAYSFAVREWIEVYLRPFGSMTFHVTDFHENHKCSTALYVHVCVLHRIALKSEKKTRNVRIESYLCLKQSGLLTELLFV